MQTDSTTPQQTNSSAIIVFQPELNHPVQEKFTTLSLQESASIQRSFELASECYNRTELVIDRLNQQTAMLKKETQDLILYREQRLQICNQLLARVEQSTINHDQTITSGFESLARINQQSVDIVQTHIDITSNNLAEDDENAKKIKILHESQAKEIESLRSSIASVQAAINNI